MPIPAVGLLSKFLPLHSKNPSRRAPVSVAFPPPIPLNAPVNHHPRCDTFPRLRDGHGTRKPLPKDHSAIVPVNNLCVCVCLVFEKKL